MTLKRWLELQNVSPEKFAEGKPVTGRTMRRWAVGACIPRRDLMALVSEWTGGDVTPADFYQDAA